MRWQNFYPRNLKTRWLGLLFNSDDAPRPSDALDSSDYQATELAPHLLLGQRGEQLAAAYLEQLGFRLVASNFKLPVGRNLRGALVHAEIDIVAYEDTTLCFIEVKTRASDWFAAPEANVDLRKQRQITRAARAYRRTFNLQHAPHRYDVVSVILPHAQPEQTFNDASSSPKLTLLRNFWTNEKFRKRRWHEDNFHH